MNVTEMVHRCKHITVGLTDEQVVAMRDDIVKKFVDQSPDANRDRYWMARVEGFLDLPPSHPKDPTYWRRWAFCDRKMKGWDATLLVEALHWKAQLWKHTGENRVPTD